MLLRTVHGRANCTEERFTGSSETSTNMIPWRSYRPWRRVEARSVRTGCPTAALRAGSRGEREHGDPRPRRRCAVELSAASARALAEAILATLDTGEAAVGAAAYP